MKLSNELDWETIWRGPWVVDYFTDASGNPRYIPLKEIEIQSVSPIISIDIFSLKTARYTWRLGGWVEIYAKFLDNKSHRLEDRKVIRLNSANLYHFKSFNLPIPYVLKLSFPFWLEALRLKVQCYIDKSGKYIDSDIGDLIDEFEGKDYTLQKVSYVRNSEDPNLLDSIFTIELPMERYRIGRFREISSGRFLPDPSIRQLPYLLIVTFTSESPIPTRAISVNVGL